jgi:hypothetical protein
LAGHDVQEESYNKDKQVAQVESQGIQRLVFWLLSIRVFKGHDERHYRELIS